MTILICGDSERGGKLSGGQRQRLSLARAGLVASSGVATRCRQQCLTQLMRMRSLLWRRCVPARRPVEVCANCWRGKRLMAWRHKSRVRAQSVRSILPLQVALTAFFAVSTHCLSPRRLSLGMVSPRLLLLESRCSLPLSSCSCTAPGPKPSLLKCTKPLRQREIRDRKREREGGGERETRGRKREKSVRAHERETEREHERITALPAVHWITASPPGCSTTASSMDCAALRACWWVSRPSRRPLALRLLSRDADLLAGHPRSALCQVCRPRHSHGERSHCGAGASGGSTGRCFSCSVTPVLA